MKRYAIDNDGRNTWVNENPNGRWVWYADAQGRIEELEALLKDAQALIQKWVDDSNEEAVSN